MIQRIEIIGDVTATGWGSDKYDYSTRKCKITLEETEDNQLRIVDYEEIKQDVNPEEIREQ